MQLFTILVVLLLIALAGIAIFAHSQPVGVWCARALTVLATALAAIVFFLWATGQAVVPFVF